MTRCTLLAAIAVAVGGVALGAQLTHAAVILSFSGTGSAEAATATNPTSTSTAITSIDAPVMIASMDGAALSPIASGYFNLSLTSISAAQALTVQNVSYIAQRFSGTFTITSGTHGAGTNYLSGTFADLVSGAGTGLTLSASDANAGETVTFTSSIIPTAHLQTPLSVNLTFADVSPSAHVTGNPATLAAFRSGITGQFSANQVSVPEAGSLALLGAGLIGLGSVRRLSRTAPRR